MIKPEELRIGNILLYKSFTVSVTMIGEFGISANDEDGCKINAKFHTGDLKHIPLTEDWLLKLGFQRGLLHGVYYSPSSDYYIVVFKGFIFRGLGASVVQVYTVHHLQNLYYALTGQELTL